MWAAITDRGLMTAGLPTKRRLSAVIRPFIIPTLASAAVLMLAFQLGSTEFQSSSAIGRRFAWLSQRSVPAASLVVGADLMGVGTPPKVSMGSGSEEIAGRQFLPSRELAERELQPPDSPTYAIKVPKEQYGTIVAPSSATASVPGGGDPFFGGNRLEGGNKTPAAAFSPTNLPLELVGQRAGMGDVEHVKKKDEASGWGIPVNVNEVWMGALVMQDSTGDGRPEALMGLPRVHGAAETVDYDPNDADVENANHSRVQDKSVDSTASAPRPASKIIKTGEITLEVQTYDDAVDRVDKIAAQFGAIVADASTQEQTGGSLTGRVVVRCAPERFEELFAALKQVGRVESEDAKAADVTAEYVDLEARIKTLQITEERLQELVKNKTIVDKVSALLEVERELSRVRTQIEQLQGQLRVMADRIGLSTITVTIHEPARTVPAASLSVEVRELNASVESLNKTLAAVAGRLAAGNITKREDGTLTGQYKLEVPLAKFADLLRGIESLGRIEQRQISQWQAADANAPWAFRVQCTLSLVLFERGRSLPTGQVRLEVDALDAAMTKLESLVASVDGAIASNKASRQADGSSSSEIKIRVPAGKFAALVDSLDPLGRTTQKQVAGEMGDIVGGAAVAPSELTLTLAERPKEVPAGGMALEVSSFGTARDLLSKLVSDNDVQVLHSSSSQQTDGTWSGSFRLGVKAADMEKVVTKLESFGRVASRQISGLGLGKLSRVDPNTIGLIDLALTEPRAINPGHEQAGGTIRERLRAGLEALYDSLGLIAYGLIVLTPWLIAVGLVGWLVVRLRRRSRTPQTT